MLQAGPRLLVTWLARAAYVVLSITKKSLFVDVIFKIMYTGKIEEVLYIDCTEERISLVTVIFFCNTGHFYKII